MQWGQVQRLCGVWHRQICHWLKQPNPPDNTPHLGGDEKIALWNSEGVPVRDQATPASANHFPLSRHLLYCSRVWCVVTLQGSRELISQDPHKHIYAVNTLRFNIKHTHVHSRTQFVHKIIITRKPWPTDDPAHCFSPLLHLYIFFFLSYIHTNNNKN